MWKPPCGGSRQLEPVDDGVLAVQSVQQKCGGSGRRNVHHYHLLAAGKKRRKNSMETLQ